MKKYTDISEIIKKKEQERRSLAALPFDKKIEMVFKLQERRKFVKSGLAVTTTRRSKAKRA